MKLVRHTLIASALICGVLVLAGCNAAAQRREATTTPGSANDNIAQPGQDTRTECSALIGPKQLRQLLKDAPGKAEAGGNAGGRFSWAAVVDREGELCALAVSSDDATATWPGSRSIAIAKASTANGFSSDTAPMSTARLYTMTQPGHSLYSVVNSNPFNAACEGSGKDTDNGIGKVCGGTIVFGGGVPLYRNNTKVGALGVSGDTSCTDHEIAKRVRDAAGLNPPKGATADDIQYTNADGPSLFAHPLCKNTWRNGMKIGDEPPAGAEY